MVGCEYQSHTFGKQFRHCEELIEASGIKWTHIRSMFFLENLFGWAHGIKSGELRLRIKDGKFAPLSINDVGEVATVVLMGKTDEHAAKKYILTGPKVMNGIEMAAVFSKILNQEVKYASPSNEDEMKELETMGLDPWQQRGFLNLLDVYANNEAAFVGRDIEKLTGRKGTTLEDFVISYRDVFVQ